MGLYIHFVQPFCHKVLRHYIHSFALGFAPFCTLLNTLASTVHGSECCNQFNCSSPSQCCAVFKYFRGSNGTTKILYLKIIKPELFQSQKSGSMTCMHAHTHMHTGIHTYIHAYHSSERFTVYIFTQKLSLVKYFCFCVHQLCVVA